MPDLFHIRRYPELQALFGEDAIGDPKKRSLADLAHDRILLKIIRGELPGGVELKSTRLAAQLEMSRTPIVKALARLAASGILQQTPNLRAIVRPGAEDWLVDIHRMRQIVEPEAARTSCGLIPAPVLDDLVLLSRDARPTDELVWQVAARGFDEAVHLTVAEFCGNLSMRQILRHCWTYKRLSYEVGKDSDDDLRRGYLQHAAILQALLAADAEAAGRLMAVHLESFAPKTPEQRIV